MIHTICGLCWCVTDLTPCQRQWEKTLVEKAEKLNTEKSLNWIWKVVGTRGKKD